MNRRPRSNLNLLLLAALPWAAQAADRMTILDEGETLATWRPVAETIAMPAYPAIVADKSQDVCVSVGYLLKADGTTSDFAVLRAWNSGGGEGRPTDPAFLPFAQNALAAVQRWKFSSIAGQSAKQRPVYTSATFAFTTQGSDPAGLKARCRVEDLNGFIAKAREEMSRKGMNRAQMEAQRASTVQATQPRVPQGTTP